jgi:hypothetical protein
VLAAEHLLGLAAFDGRGQLVQAANEVVEDRLARFEPLDQHREILAAPLEGPAQVAILLEAAAPLQQLLRPGLVLPEVRLGDALLYLCEFFCVAGDVKDSSAGRRRGAPDPDTCEAARRAEWP